MRAASLIRKKDLVMLTYDRVSLVNHWTAAVLFMAMLCSGFFLAYDGLSPEAKMPLLGNHKALGVVLLVWGTWRVGYRIWQGFARPLGNLPTWEVGASHVGHVILLPSVLAMPLSHFVMALYSGFPTNVFGMFTIPPIVKINMIAGTARMVHKWVAYVFNATLAVYIAAALKHHFIDKDGTLRRMATGRS